jgi:sporulation protein YlmC with PRC-barrel domain
MAMQRISLGAVVLAMLLGTTALAQVVPPVQQNPADRPNQANRTDKVNPSDRTTVDTKAFKASEILGLNIKSTNDQNVGEVKDLRIQRDGKIAYAVVSFGGFLGIGDKLFAVPFEALHIVKSNDDKLYAHLDVTEQTLKSKQGFDKDHWPEKADESFMTGAPRQVGQLERPSTGTPNTR